MRDRIAIILLLFMVILFASAPLYAKIYVWTDEENRVHYCNDPDDVPEPYRVKTRTIESQGAKKDHARTPSTMPPSVSSPPPPPTATPVAGREAGEIEGLMERYRITREELQKFRVGGKNQNSPDYEQLKNQLVEIKRQINDIRLQRNDRKE